MRLEAERRAVVDTARRMADSGLIVNTAGNVSVRAGAWIAITPNAMPYDTMTPADICLVDVATGAAEAGSLNPSSELPLHLEVYRTTSAGAVVHTHSHFATVLSTIAEELPAIHYHIADLGGTVKVAPYATFGSDELARSTAAHLAQRNAVLMRNHGATTIAGDLEKALARAFTVEWIASVYWHAKMLGTPTILDEAELARVLARQREHALARAQRRAERSQ
jgi:L-fuculose-phosphate aldolase